MPTMPDRAEKMAKILEKMRTSTPFITLCSEACGVIRDTVFWWIYIGENKPEANPAFKEFARQVRQIRAEWMLRITQELQQTPPEKTQTEHYRRKAWLLERMDRDLFDPPRYSHEKRDDKSEGKALKSATPEAVAAAAQDLALPEPELEPPQTH